jgi:hypothetical protein
MKETAEEVASMNAAVLIPAEEHHRGRRVGWLHSQRPMRPMPVVVVDVDPEHSFMMLARDDQQPVETLGLDGPDPALRARWRWAPGLAQHHVDALRAEDVVERWAELPVTVADEEAHPASLLLQYLREVAGLLGYPGVVGVGWYPAKCTNLVSRSMKNSTYSAAARCVNGEEVAGQDSGGLLAQESSPGGGGSPWGGVKTVGAQHPPDRVG